MDDLISRQAAIDALDVLCQEHRYKIPGKFETYSQYNEAWQDALDRAEGAIGNLPTIHPEPPKMGKWVEVHGWATPGGDPVWACSECGKGLHVYGIEHGTYGSDVADGQWVACPNCGAQMEEEDDTVD